MQTQLKKSLNIQLILDQADPVKRAEASLNNVSYAQSNIDKQIKLETGQITENFNMNFELALLDKRVEEKTLKELQDTPGSTVKDKLIEAKDKL